MNTYQKLTSLIGNTPLYELETSAPSSNTRILAKLEMMSVGGSVKDRLGFYIIEQALKTRKLHQGGTVIEPTAGNTAIGLALAAIHFKVHAIFVIPQGFSQEKQTLARALGATIVNTPKELGMKGAVAKARELVQEIEGAYNPNQFHTEWNPEAYYYSLAREIYEGTEGKLDVFVAGAGTSGTFMGVSKYLKEQNPSIKTVIVEPQGSIINGGKSGSHETEGIGMEFFPPFFDKALYDEAYTISDKAAFARVAQLAKEEGLLVGSSSGAVFEACCQIADQTDKPLTIVTIFPDSGERYLSKNIYGGDRNHA